MASFTKFQKFSLNLSQKVFNLGSDTLMVALTNTAPTASSNNQLSDITEIAYTNCSSRSLTISSSTQTSGTYKLVIADLVLTASGTVGPFRYVVIYDNTATNKELICYFDYGSNLTLANGDTFTLDFDNTNGLLQLT